MQTVYRDYGTTQLAIDAREYPAPPNEFNIEQRRQVYQATHRGDGTRLPFMNRSFISFKYGGRYIEDFDLIATIVNNRISKDGYAQFNDLVTSYDVLDGQYYWGTHYQTNTLQFVLSTDGIDQKTLDDFLYWFHAGDTKELVLSEHVNRGILARVANPPQLSLLPFEHDTEILISGESYKTKTTLYKGDITLELVMDSPHWYAIDNIIGKIKDVVVNGVSKKRYVDLWDDETQDENKQEVEVFASKEALKILVEDGIPLASMIHNNMLLGNGAYASVEDNVYSLIWSLPENSIEWIDGVPTGRGARIDGVLEEDVYALRSLTAMAIDQESDQGLCIKTESGIILQFDKPADFIADNRECLPGDYDGIIAGPIVDAEGHGIEELARNKFAHFYYAGTAPSPTIIQFTIQPRVSMSTGYYIANPSSTWRKNPTTGQPYDSFFVESKNKAELRFTTPNLYTSYNRAIELIKTYVKNGSTQTWEGFRQIIREEVRHAHVRRWVIKLIDNLSDTYIINSSSTQTKLCTDMMQLIRDDNNRITSATFTFNSETGEAMGEFKYRTFTEDGSSSSLTTQIEDVGDMLRSNYIIIRDRNYPTEDGFITKWLDTNEVTKQYSHRVYHNSEVPLTQLQIRYRNMYL